MSYNISDSEWTYQILGNNYQNHYRSDLELFELWKSNIIYEKQLINNNTDAIYCRSRPFGESSSVNLNTSPVQNNQELCTSIKKFGEDILLNDIRNDTNISQIRHEFSENGVDYEYFPKPTNKNSNKKKLSHCVFCLNNGEPEYVYARHPTNDEKKRVICPHLRNYECPICGSKGDNAHTIKYCPDKPIITMEEIFERKIKKKKIFNSKNSLCFPNISSDSNDREFCNSNSKYDENIYFKGIPNDKNISQNQHQYSAYGVNCDKNRHIIHKQSNNANKKHCEFCLNKGEPEYVYTTHPTNDENGRVICPNLRNYQCRLCGATGDTAHAVEYCPDKLVMEQFSGRKIKDSRFRI